jgi:predicted nucleic acid-binding protein
LGKVACPPSPLPSGEAEVLALGCEKKDSLLILDDALARKIAKLQSLKYTGTIGILLKAKERKYIKEIAPILKKLKEVNFYLSNEFIKKILKIAGENNPL